MPARDAYHDVVKRALVKDGWTITDDPLHLRWGRRNLYVDLGAERLFGAEKGERRIAVEVKTFLGISEMEELQHAIGQYTLYHDVMAETHPGRQLYLAVPDEVYFELFEEPIGQIVLGNRRVLLVVFNVPAEEVRKWID